MNRRRDPAELSRVEQALASLTYIEREVLRLGAAEDLRNHEIAARLGISARKVERILARALAKLDRAVSREERPWWRFW
jgi:RNA polymerase sigma factor (sigma-70 family)